MMQIDTKYGWRTVFPECIGIGDWLPAWQGITIGILKRALSDRMINYQPERDGHSDACHRDMYAGSGKPCSCGLDVALVVREEMMEDGH